MYITGFCLLPRYCEIFISRCGESLISSPSNSHRPSITFEGYQIVGLYTPTIIPEFTANTRSACLALSPFNLQYFLVHSYKFGRLPDKYVLLTFRQKIFSSVAHIRFSKRIFYWMSSGNSITFCLNYRDFLGS